MKSRPPIWPVGLIFATVGLLLLASAFDLANSEIDAKWAVAIALSLVVFRIIYTLNNPQKPNQKADQARMRENIKRGTRGG